ncbi:Fructose-1,6-bisphosphatase, type I [hydrothermal vent metagenome]|uniref:fructose-bisphosphatase n=1 Tax=hydrothermal vent metagenome TaxID=652676 RepID=A0A3B0RFW1_9ZZZZ
MRIGMPLTKFLYEEQRRCPDCTGNFTDLFSDLARGAKIISRDVNMAGLINILGSAELTNVQGEDVQKLDLIANNALVSTMEHGGHLAAMASEEEADIIPIPDEFPKGDYILLFDPLDGSSNIDVNVSVGTIFSILKKKTSGENAELSDFLQPGSEQVCAGYFLYGSSTMLVYTTGRGVHGFTLDPSVGEFLLSHEDIKTPEQGTIYSLNESNSNKWHDSTYKFIRKAKERGCKARYVGSLVADFHRNLLKGGVFLYPADKESCAGKLRLLYEANPMAFIIEQAGGSASNGTMNIMDIQPEGLHQRTPLIIGSKSDVEEAVECCRAEAAVGQAVL